MLVGLGERGVLPRSADDVTDLVGVRVGRPRVPEPSVTDDPDADAARLGELQALDLAAERLRLRPARLLRVGLDRLARLGGVDRDPARGPRDQALVPPTVMREIRRVGEPLPTGACCPSLPQTPSQVSKSPATASTADITWIARPIRLAPRTGVVTVAVLDQERFGAPEHEVAARRVDLPAAERRDEDALLRALDDRVGSLGAVEDVRVRHPRDRRARVGLATPVPGGAARLPCPRGAGRRGIPGARRPRTAPCACSARPRRRSRRSPTRSGSSHRQPH